MTHSSLIHFHDFQPDLNNFKEDILQGLKAKQKYIAPKYFYDDRGSELFDRICWLPEYYLTRTEIGLLKQYGTEMARHIGTDTLLFELGSGSSLKIRLLLEAIQPRHYVPLDISQKHLYQSAQALAKDFPWLEIHALCVDFTGPWTLPSGLEGNRRVAFFPGSSIGNWEYQEAVDLLRRIAGLVGTEGGLLIGVDLIKTIDLLERAYNDRQKVTEAFNKNLLERINRELDADFRLDDFRHLAFYNRDMNRIEMHLMSERDQTVRISNQDFIFHSGETIHTENSHKYSIAGFQRLALSAGFYPIKVWTDPDNFFSIHYLKTQAS